MRKAMVILGLSVFLLGMGEYEGWKNRPREEFAEPAKAFAAVKDKLLAKYYDQGLTEAELYRYAVRGMLDGLNRDGKNWNRLFSPSEYKEFAGDAAGKVVGIGIEMKFEPETGIAEVLGVIPGTPAEKEDVKPGDQILRIGGKSYKGQNLRDVVYAIRGRSGEKVALTILRGDKVLSRSVRREAVPWNVVEHSVLPGDTGLVVIRYFSETTPGLLREALADLAKKGVKALVVDLRNNQGGLFDKAVESIGLFLPGGKPIVTVVKRGGAEETLTAKGSPIVSGLPIAVLANDSTSCGAELMASALRENLGAPLVGHKTFGKLNAQTVEELPNGYAYKFTSSVFRTPSGKVLDGVGLEPDFAVDLPGDRTVETVQRIRESGKRLAEDPPLRTALGVLKIRRNESL